MGEGIDLTIDSGCAACALPVGVASAVVMQELNSTPQEYIAANAVKIRELGFKTPRLKIPEWRRAEFEVQNHGQIAQTSGDGVHCRRSRCSRKIKVIPSLKMGARSAGNGSLNEMDCTY